MLKVSDGGNITINSYGTEINVQLYGIEAPVMASTNKLHGWMHRPGQPGSRESFAALANKVLHQQVKIEILSIASYKKPPFQQAVAIVSLDKRDINREMVAEGWAWAVRNNPDRIHGKEYVTAEKQARARKLGLWAKSNPQPPWEFRQKLKGNNEPGW